MGVAGFSPFPVPHVSAALVVTTITLTSFLDTQSVTRDPFVVAAHVNHLPVAAGIFLHVPGGEYHLVTFDCTVKIDRVSNTSNCVLGASEPF